MTDSKVNKTSSDRQLLMFLLLWLASTGLLYFAHLGFGWYHGSNREGCRTLVWLPTAFFGYGVTRLVALSKSGHSPDAKVIRAIVTIVIFAPLIGLFGFIWTMMHLAP